MNRERWQHPYQFLVKFHVGLEKTLFLDVNVTPPPPHTHKLHVYVIEVLYLFIIILQNLMIYYNLHSVFLQTMYTYYGTCTD